MGDSQKDTRKRYSLKVSEARRSAVSLGDDCVPWGQLHLADDESSITGEFERLARRLERVRPNYMSWQ